MGGRLDAVDPVASGAGPAVPPARAGGPSAAAQPSAGLTGNAPCAGCNGAQAQVDAHGVLVGWSGAEMGAWLQLRIQSVTRPPPHRREDVATRLLLLDRNQAVQLGNFLFQLAGQTPPRHRRRRLWQRLLPE